MNTPVFNPAMVEMLEASIVSLRDPMLTVVENVNWTVLPGEFWVVAGQQRSGKSDLLLHAAGLMSPAQGACKLFGCDTREFDEAQLSDRLRLGVVFADGKLFNQLTIAENVALPLRYHKDLTEAEAARLVEVLLELLELSRFANLFPANLSASWRKRVALARALVLKPEILLLDDPLAGLGARHLRWQLDFLGQLWKGHEFFGGSPMTIVALSDNLRPWQHSGRKFAVLHEGTFTALGAWDGEPFSRHHAVKDLLSAPNEFNSES